MKKSLRLVLRVLLVGAFCVSPALTGAAELDLSNFSSLQFTRHPGLGFCPPVDSVFSATITRQNDDEYLLQMSFVELGDGFPPEEGCIEGAQVPVPDACAKEVPLADRLLTPDEIFWLQHEFSSVRVADAPDPRCPITEPCVINVFEFDTFVLSSDPCADPRLEPDENDRLVDLLNALRVDVEDLSHFGTFAFGRQPALGFCPPLNEVFTAEIQRNLDPGDNYVLSMTILEEGDRAVDECLNDQLEFFFVDKEVDCVVETLLPERLLEASEVDRIREAFSALPSYPGPEVFCRGIAIDPCLINVAAWDGVEYSDFPCGGGRHVAYRDMAEVITILNDLSQFRPTLRDNGDVNGDGSRDLSDCVYLLNWLFAGGSAPVDVDCPKPCAGDSVTNGDVNGDGDLNIADPLYELNWLFGGGPGLVSVCTCL